MKMQTYLIIGVIAALIGGVIGWGANGWRLSAEVAKAKEEYSDAKLDAWHKFLDDLQANMGRMADAAEVNKVKTADIDAGVDKLVKGLRNAKPMPVECRLDDFRVKELQATVSELQKTLQGVKK